MKQYTRD